MPYIVEKQREPLDPLINQLVDILQHKNEKEIPGSINYIITALLTRFYFERAASVGLSEPNYFMNNEIVGILESAKLEWYRAVTGPYEEIKRTENGDVTIRKG